MEIQVPLGHRVWGGRKGQGKEGRAGFRLESHCSLIPTPGALGHELQDRVSPTLRPGVGLVTSCHLLGLIGRVGRGQGSSLEKGQL